MSTDESAWVPGRPDKGVRVTVLDDEGRGETSVIDNDYIVVCAGNRYIAHTTVYANGTHIVTIKREEAPGG